MCLAGGNPLPLITWSAFDITGEIVTLTSTSNVIRDGGNEILSTLDLPSEMLDMVSCTADNGIGVTSSLEFMSLSTGDYNLCNCASHGTLNKKKQLDLCTCTYKEVTFSSLVSIKVHIHYRMLYYMTVLMLEPSINR